MARTTSWTLLATAATLLVAAACNDSQSPTPRAWLGLPDLGTLAVNVTTPRPVSLIAGLVAATTFSVSCTAPPPPPTTGDLTVTTGTSGSNIDADGYTVTVDGNASKSIGSNGSVTFSGLAAGNHSVALSGVASNCSVSGNNPRTVSVPAGGTASTSFSVSCTAPPPQTGNLTVSTSTSGSNLDPDGYTVTVDGGASQAIGTNGSVTFSGLSAASHTVVLSGVANNCSGSGGASRTGGSTLDPDGYTAPVDGGASQSVATTGSVPFTGLWAASHTVVLSGVASN